MYLNDRTAMWVLKIFLAILVLVCNQFCFAQEVKKINYKPDTASINKILKKAYKLREVNTDSAGILYTQALNQSRSIGFRNGIGEALCGFARYYNITNEQEKALNYIRSAFPYFENNQKGKQLYVSANLLLSESFFYLGIYDSCSFYRYAALNYIEKNHITNPNLQLSVYSKILQFWLNAHEDIKHDKNIQKIMQQINDLENQAVANKDSNLLVNIYFQKAGYYHNISQNDSARYYGNKNIELGSRLHVAPSMIMACHLDIALTYIDDKQPLPAIDHIKKAVAAAPEIGKSSNRYLIFADIFLGQAYILQGRYHEAINLVKPALFESKKLNIISILAHAHKTLSEAYEGVGDYKNAAEQQKLYSIAKDSLMKTEKMELSYNLEMKYRIAEKNKELAEKELNIVKNEIRIRNKNILIAFTTSGLLLLVLISLLIFRNNKHKQKLQAEKITGLKKEMQIKTLKAQVTGSEKERSRIARDLHDGISGTIGSARARVGMIQSKYKNDEINKDLDEVKQLLEDASTELRKTAHNLMPEILLREGLVYATELFCDRVNNNHELNINFTSNGKLTRLPQEVELSLYRIIQELVNNIIKHANAKNAIVQIGFNKNIISITVEDDGNGMPVNNTGFGVGLNTIKDRIESLNGIMDITSNSIEGTSVYIEVDSLKIKAESNEY